MIRFDSTWTRISLAFSVSVNVSLLTLLVLVEGLRVVQPPPAPRQRSHGVGEAAQRRCRHEEVQRVAEERGVPEEEVGELLLQEGA
jgi:hypothetical protein